MFTITNYLKYSYKVNNFSLTISFQMNKNGDELYTANLIGEEQEEPIFSKSFEKLEQAVNFCNFRYINIFSKDSK